ncbi:MAG TPA: RIP metalloprotease RseP [Sphaerochaeta sp.]|nr:RIP metalloprotease RseP [Sphaerochaeta sp.]HPB41760.1 RIP metalloprotease RseP [Sphaerochaeta sp.]HPY46160.1 RIP metalloprotease RseP [Sphaerochaeta sp.]HQB05408.1 RIP metalloprotease RseP [Sphaerochaeta sp.]
MSYFLAQVIKYLIGIVGITVVVLIHELGHFVAARICGIDVEVFSFGFGPRLIGKHIGDLDLRLSLFPVGGYCRLKGSDDVRQSLRNEQSLFLEEGSIFAASPIRRIITYLAGPVASFLLALLIYTILSLMPYEVLSTEAIVTTVNDYPELFGPEATSPAYDAGIRSGDRVLALNGETIDDWEALETILPVSPEHLFMVERNGQSFHYWVEGEKQADGTYRYGLAVLQEAIVGNVRSLSTEKEAGLKKGDRIIASQGTVVHNHLDLLSTLRGELSRVEFTVLRDGEEVRLSFHPRRGDDGKPIFDFSLLAATKHVKPTSKALTSGVGQTSKILHQTLDSIRSLFTGTQKDLRSNVTGVTRSALLIGDIAALGFEQETKQGLHALLYLLGVVSISLAVVNLLPLPAFDGIQIMVAFLALITGHTIKMRTYYVLQVAGVLFIIVVFIALAGSDLRYLLSIRR